DPRDPRGRYLLFLRAPRRHLHRFPGRFRFPRSAPGRRCLAARSRRDQVSARQSGQLDCDLRTLERPAAGAFTIRRDRGEEPSMKRFASIALLVTLTAAAGALLAANKYGAPHSVIHVVTILWKEDTTPEQQQAALDGVRKMADAIPGIRNIW